MEEYKIQILQSGILFVLYFISIIFTAKAIDKAGNKFSYQKPRIQIVKKIINFILLSLTLGILFSILGVEQSQLFYFVSSLITILGIAFFAQWSIISNITSTLIIFFNHPAKIGDHIEVFDADFPVKGTIVDVGIFFVILKTEDNYTITIPSNIFTQKMIVKKEKK